MIEGFSFGDTEYIHASRYQSDETSTSFAGRIAIVGLANAGKKTLCNSLWGWEAVQTNGETTRHFGLLTLIDLPHDPYDAAGVLYRLESANLIIFVLDGERGLEPESFNWIARLRGLPAAMLVTVNKADRLPADQLKPMLQHVETRAARPVVPTTATDPQDIRENLLAAILRICPELAVPLATKFPALRSSVAAHAVMQAVLLSLTLNFDVSAQQDSSMIVGLQLRLVRQIAAVYGYKEQPFSRQRLGLSIGLRWMLHTAIKQVAHIQKLEGRIGSGLLSAGITFLVGRATMLAYGGQLPRWIAPFTPQAWRMKYARVTVERKS